MSHPSPSPETVSPPIVTLVIKNPSATSPGDFRLEIPADATVLAVKQKLQRDYVGHPDPSKQKLIVAGQVIKDVRTVRDLYKQVRPGSSRHQSAVQYAYVVLVESKK